MKALTHYKNILWDFDGVLMDSMEVRDRGFEEVLKSFPPPQVQQLMDFHRQNGGLSRYVKFRHFFEDIRGEAISHEAINDYAARFSKIMLHLLIDKNLLIPDSLRFVKENYSSFNFHIVSGSNGSELQKICKGIGLSPYFKTIEGSPTPKNKLVRQILKKYHYSKPETCLIGDSINDFEAARVNEIDFFGYNNLKLKKISRFYIMQFY